MMRCNEYSFILLHEGVDGLIYVTVNAKQVLLSVRIRRGWVKVRKSREQRTKGHEADDNKESTVHKRMSYVLVLPNK